MIISSLARLLNVCKSLKSLNPIYCGVAGMGQKNTFFEKRTGEVVENKEKWLKNEPERTGKRSGEVVENIILWKKRTGNEPENEAGHVIENKRWRKNEPKTNRSTTSLFQHSMHFTLLRIPHTQDRVGG